jgi:hypothetical protein
MSLYVSLLSALPLLLLPDSLTYHSHPYLEPFLLRTSYASLMSPSLTFSTGTLSSEGSIHSVSRNRHFFGPTLLPSFFVSSTLNKLYSLPPTSRPGHCRRSAQFLDTMASPNSDSYDGDTRRRAVKACDRCRLRKSKVGAYHVWSCQECALILYPDSVVE